MYHCLINFDKDSILLDVNGMGNRVSRILKGSVLPLQLFFKSKPVLK